MQAGTEYDGEIAYDLEDFCKDHGHPDGRTFTFEVTHHAVTYVYAELIGTVRDGQVVFSFDKDDLVHTRKAN